MRTPVVACAVFAATAFCPWHVLAAPVSSTGVFDPSHYHTTAGGSMIHNNPRELMLETRAPHKNKHGKKTAMEPRDDVASSILERKIEPRKISPRLSSRALDKDTAGGNAYSGSAGDASGGSAGRDTLGVDYTYTREKRTTDADTLGGNAYTGSTGDASGGGVSNVSNDAGMPTIMNVNSNNAGLGGTSASGCSSGGLGNNNGAGGNAYSGSSGNAEGGSVSNVGGMFNMDSNNGGAAGYSESGCATGGNTVLK
ncbi:hypothetical protein BKA93DRAFT_303091 [Sparassis latifolia]|uniref:Uncharacterized protein n=1 Tax=Sparassis crispa TaxID=139825 RepID=A0A401G7P8_9APHY|nr:hypothetical protein SCP_0110620 [Sparassis crispa]GBE78179.1 hypothetical protein SCP_0110620 [Sparassis crispa]